MRTNLTVEIFRDFEFPDSDIRIAHDGIEKANVAAKHLEIVRDTRRLRLGADPTQPLDTDAIRWPRLESDISIVLTGRALLTATSMENATTVGVAHMMPSGEQSVAIINTLGFNAIDTVAHETGHMLHLTYNGNKDRAHCENKNCTMHAVVDGYKDTERVKKTGINAWMERRGYRTAEYIEKMFANNTDFCDPCQVQLAQRAFFLLQHKQGKHVPEGLR